MKYKIIRSRLKAKPNMGRYEDTRKRFSWKSAENEIMFFDKRRTLLNAAYNAADRHCISGGKKTAIIHVDEKGKETKITFQQLMEQSNRFANVLKKCGVRRRDRVFVFLPRIPAVVIAFLGTLKTGAICGTMFAAFGPAGLEDRLNDSRARVLVTNRMLAKRVNRRRCKYLKHVLIVESKSFRNDMKKASSDFKCARTKRSDTAFMLYTSGTTGKPKGIVHEHNAIVQQHMTAKYVLDLKPNDVYWCTADYGWVTGIAYGILGSLSNYVTHISYEGRFDAKRWYGIIKKYGVTVWYTAPTAVRMLKATTNEKIKLASLRHICSVGEPLNPEAIYWAQHALGQPIYDNYWQTETGGIMIANYPGMAIRAGSMGRPVPGVRAMIVDDRGRVLPADKEGNLAFEPGWPSMMAGVWRNGKRYSRYFVNYKGKRIYMSGDRAYRDRDGYYWFVGRQDDVIKTAGERVGPFEVESTIDEHKDVVESAVIGKPDVLRGQIIKAFVVLKKSVRPTEAKRKEIQIYVKKHLAGHAYPREIDFVASLPKTRSGKIMRRVLKANELGLPVGDTSALEK